MEVFLEEYGLAFLEEYGLALFSMICIIFLIVTASLISGYDNEE